ncbi:arsenate reductase (glutaredoxin) [Flavobacterium aciduliphilum]|uniref:Arsenate reductase n=1 Tax=Flavobacterium aciduliphilum TaxID=1101402 RepID=A0A328YAF2_9FLAO|nr:arsenate reductase (glutaredoxin) [Flavobacterium aciduliphilum]RAR70144.1 arsenate reductase [Flavobacterium aciduliphilum]
MITVYHNPRCGKSRACVAFLEQQKEPFELVKYLEHPLNFKQIQQLLQALDCTPIALIRTKESVWTEHFKGKELSDTELIQALVDYPILMERPVVVKGKRAVIARPLEHIEKLF